MSLNRHRVKILPAMLLAIATTTGMTIPTKAEESLQPILLTSTAGEPGTAVEPGKAGGEGEASLAGGTGSAPDDAGLVLLADPILHAPPVPAAQEDHAPPSAVKSNREEVAEPISPTGPSGKLREWVAVETHLLDDLRGGFDTSLHLTLSFGIERAVYLNGTLVTTTSFNLPAMRGMGIEEVSGLGKAGSAELPLSSVAVLQNGAGNSFSSSSSNLPLAGTVIQNTLNNQSIHSLTTINASANSLQLLRANAFQTLLKDSINQSVGTR